MPRLKKPAKEKTQNKQLRAMAEWVDIATLQGYYKNPRMGDIEVVAESLNENGQYKPIVVNRGTLTGRKNEILAGNHTKMAAERLGWQYIYVTWVDVSENRAAKIVLTDNSTADAGTYDDTLLADIMNDIKDNSDTLVGTGYTDELLGKMVAQQQKDRADNPEDVGETSGGYAGYQIDDKDTSTIESQSKNLGGVEELNNDVWFESDLLYGIPPLNRYMCPSRLPRPLDTWGGHELDLDRVDDYYWLLQWAAGSAGIRWDRAYVYTWCVDEATQALTKRGWVNGDDLSTEDEVLSMRPDGVMAWSPVRKMTRYRHQGKMHRITGQKMDALVTPGHKFPLRDGSLMDVEKIGSHDSLRTFGSAEESEHQVYSDAFVELVGWVATEGNYTKCQNSHHKKSKCNHSGIWISQNEGPHLNRIELALKRCGVGNVYRYNRDGGNTQLHFSGEIARNIREVAPGQHKVLSTEFITALSRHQRDLLIRTMIDGDGTRENGRERYTQHDKAHMDAFLMLCSLEGRPTTCFQRDSGTKRYSDKPIYVATLLMEREAQVRNLNWHGGRGDFRKGQENFPVEDYDGMVWCPTTDYGTFVCRRNGHVYVTGNCPDEHFERMFTDPKTSTKKLINAQVMGAVAPNFTVDKTYPEATWIWAKYRSNYVARYWQEAGIMVIPEIQFGAEDEGLDLALTGIPEGMPVGMQAQNHGGDMDRIRKRARLLREVEKRLEFPEIVVYGHKDADKLIDRANLDADVIRVQNRTARRREYLDSGSATINTTSTGKKVLRKK